MRTLLGFGVGFVTGFVAGIAWLVWDIWKDAR